MRTTYIYHKDGTKTVIEGRKTYSPSYDSQIDLPMHQRILNGYRDMEAQGKLRPTDIVKSKSYVKNLHERALAYEQAYS
jgi:hypothetical protein